MRKTFGKAFRIIKSDLGKNKFFTILIMVEITILIIVAASLLMNFDTTKTIEKALRSQYRNALAVEVKDFKEQLKGENIDNFGMSRAAHYKIDGKEIGASVINTKMSEYFKVPHSGEWFSGVQSEEYCEAIVSKKLKDKFKKGKIYELSKSNISSERKNNIKVIGYLNDDDFVINKSEFFQFDSFFASGRYQMMICDTITHDQVGDTVVFVTDSGDQDYYINNFNARVDTLGNMLDKHKEGTFPLTYFMSVICGIIFALIIVAVLCNSMLKADLEIRRNIVKYLSGCSTKLIAVTEVVKTSILFVVPFLLDVVITAIMISVTKGGSFVIISWSGFAIAAAMVFIAYCVTVTAGLIKVLMAKPLKEMKK